MPVGSVSPFGTTCSRAEPELQLDGLAVVSVLTKLAAQLARGDLVAQGTDQERPRAVA